VRGRAEEEYFVVRVRKEMLLRLVVVAFEQFDIDPALKRPA
jgi:hypothetical protein